MITAYRIQMDRCNGCYSKERIVEFRIEPTRAGGMLVRFCWACREELRARIDEHRVVESTIVIAPSWSNTESVRARQAAGQPVSFLESIQARPRELDAPQDTTLTLPDGTVLDRAAIDELLISMGYRRKPTTTRKKAPATRKKPSLPVSHRKKARKRA